MKANAWYKKRRAEDKHYRLGLLLTGVTHLKVRV